MTMSSNHAASFQEKSIIKKYSISQLNPSHYLMSVIQSSSIEYRFPGYTDIKTVKLSLALITIPEGCSIFTTGFPNSSCRLLYVESTQ